MKREGGGLPFYGKIFGTAGPPLAHLLSPKTEERLVGFVGLSAWLGPFIVFDFREREKSPRRRILRWDGLQSLAGLLRNACRFGDLFPGICYRSYWIWRCIPV